MQVVLVMFKDGKRRDFPMKKSTLSIGRQPESDLRIPTPDVSRRHCELVIEDDTLIIHDVGSSNGTYVNGRSIEEVELKAGDQIKVGPITFVVQIDGKPSDLKGPDVAPALHRRAETDDTEELLDLDDLELSDDDDDEDPMSAIESILDLDDDDDDDKV